LRVSLLTREYPPEVYGGAGVHVEYLSRHLAPLVELTVHCWGAERRSSPDGPAVVSYRPWETLEGASPHGAALAAVSIDLAMAAGCIGADVVHSHTWYANLGGHLAKLIHGVPHVATVHSLEPMRPWKAEQLGGGYALSSFCERTALEAADAIVAVSKEHSRDILACYPAVEPTRVTVIGNGVDTDEYRPDPATDVLEGSGIDPSRPAVVFVGRITRQKGLTYLLDAAPLIDPGAQLVLCAGAPDTPELAAEIASKVERVRAERGGVIWLGRMLSKREVIQILGHATVFVCPSIYEPLGIVNLEAMACEAAVVATATGGIPEVVEDGVTGLLVPFDPVDDASREPRAPAQFVQDLTDRVNALLSDPGRAKELGAAGRRRAIERFSWSAVAARTVELYRAVLAPAATGAGAVPHSSPVGGEAGG
jgi:starch synthase